VNLLEFVATAWRWAGCQ